MHKKLIYKLAVFFLSKGECCEQLEAVGDDRGCYLKISLLGEFSEPSEGNEKMNYLR